MNQRYVKFRPTELQRITGEPVQQKYCPHISKSAEGDFNEVVPLRPRNDREVIAQPSFGQVSGMSGIENIALLSTFQRILAGSPRSLCWKMKEMLSSRVV